MQQIRVLTTVDSWYESALESWLKRQNCKVRVVKWQFAHRGKTWLIAGVPNLSFYNPTSSALVSTQSRVTWTLSTRLYAELNILSEEAPRFNAGILSSMFDLPRHITTQDHHRRPENDQCNYLFKYADDTRKQPPPEISIPHGNFAKYGTPKSRPACSWNIVVCWS